MRGGYRKFVRNSPEIQYNLLLCTSPKSSRNCCSVYMQSDLYLLPKSLSPSACVKRNCLVYNNDEKHNHQSRKRLWAELCHKWACKTVIYGGRGRGGKVYPIARDHLPIQGQPPSHLWCQKAGSNTGIDPFIS